MEQTKVGLEQDISQCGECAWRNVRDIRQKFLCHFSAMLGLNRSTEGDVNAMYDGRQTNNEMLYMRSYKK